MSSESTLAIVAALILVGQLLVLVGQFVLAARANRQLEISVTAELIDAWKHERPNWYLLLVYVGYGPPFVVGDPKDREAFKELLQESKQLDEKQQQDLDQEAHAQLWNRRRELSQELAPFETRVFDFLLFLDTVAGLLVRGRLSVRTAFEILGKEVVRNAGTLRKVMDQPPYSGWVRNTGIRKRVLVLVDALWGEAARTIEFGAGEITTVAKMKREEGTGLRNRRRLRRVVRPVGGRTTARRLNSVLLWAEVPADVSQPSRRIRRLGRRFAGIWSRFQGFASRPPEWPEQG